MPDRSTALDDDPMRRKIDAVPTRGVLAIDPAEVHRQRAEKWPDFHPELFCHRCGRRNVSAWSAGRDEWARATEGLPRGVAEILCPVCFAALYEENTGETVVWEMRRWRPVGDAEVAARCLTTLPPRTALDDTIARLTGQQRVPLAASPARAGQGSADGPERDASSAGPLASSLNESQSLPPLWFDGSSWTRRARRRANETDHDPFGEPLPIVPITVGWEVETTHTAADGFPTCGVVYDVDEEHVEADTGEVVPLTLHLVVRRIGPRGGVRDIERLAVTTDALVWARPAGPRVLTDMARDCAREAARGHVAAAHRRWLLSIAVRMEAV